jgi:hypothetical protein
MLDPDAKAVPKRFDFFPERFIQNGTVFVKKRDNQNRKEFSHHETYHSVRGPRPKPPRGFKIPNQGIKKQNQQRCDAKRKQLLFCRFPKPRRKGLVR